LEDAIRDLDVILERWGLSPAAVSTSERIIQDVDTHIICDNLNRQGVDEQLPGFEDVRCDRRTVLGNPFRMGRGGSEESLRETAIAAHAQYLDRIMADADVDVGSIASLAGTPVDPRFSRSDPARVRDTIKALADRVVRGHRLRLLCWCHPKPCHAHAVSAAVLRIAQTKGVCRAAYSAATPPSPRDIAASSKGVPAQFWVKGLGVPCAYYIPGFLDRNVADHALQEFVTGLDWRTNDKTMNRWTALYGEAGQYRYGRTHAANRTKDCSEESDLPTADLLPWTPLLANLKAEAEAWYLREAGKEVHFTVCLANLYQDGSQGIAWHSDREEVGLSTPIASFSFGAERLFDLRSQTVHRDQPREQVGVLLEHGSLIIMENECQRLYHHRIAKDSSDSARVNLTFRAKPLATAISRQAAAVAAAKALGDSSEDACSTVRREKAVPAESVGAKLTEWSVEVFESIPSHKDAKRRAACRELLVNGEFIFPNRRAAAGDVVSLEESLQEGTTTGSIERRAVVTEAEDGARMEKFAHARFSSALTSLSVCRAAVKRMEVAVNGVPCEGSRILHQGDEVVLALSVAEASAAVDRAELIVHYEDGHVAVVMKPASMDVFQPVRGGGGKWKVLEKALPFNLSPSEEPDALPAPRAFNDLPRAATGLVLIAKTARAEEGFRRREVNDSLFLHYRAVVFGVPSGEEWNAGGRRSVLAVSPGGDQAVVDLVEASPKAWLAGRGHPVVGDDKAAKAAAHQQVKGLYLALLGIKCEHPVKESSGQPISVFVQAPGKFGKYGAIALAAPCLY